jgi:hypothetical protein
MAMAAGLVLVAGASGSCDPIAGKAASIYFVGDSILFDATVYNTTFKQPAPTGYGVRVDSDIGATSARWLASVQAYAKQNVPERLVVELGTNDARNDGGWSAADDDGYRALVGAAPARTCIVFVLPAVTDAAPAADRAAVDEGRAAIAAVAAAEPRHHVVVDFAAFQADHPDDVRSDGVHLATDTDERRQQVQDDYRDWLWPSVLACTP